MEAEQRKVEKEKKQLLRAMKKYPHQPVTEWLKALGWLNSNKNKDTPRITKRLNQLEADGLVIKIGHRYLVK